MPGCSCNSVSKAVPHLNEYLPRIDEMRSAKGLTIVEQDPPVRRVDRGERRRPSLAKALAHGQIHRGASRKVRRAVLDGKARSVSYICGCPRSPRQVRLEARAERVPLVVVEREATLRRRCKIGKAAADSALSLHVLIGVC